MLDRLWRGPERRRHRRHEAATEVRVAVELYGFKNEVEPFFTSGVTRDIGRGGFLADLDAPLNVGSICNVFFRETEEAIRPHHLSGRVVRCQEIGDEFRIAVEFDEPLLRLAADQLERERTLA